MNVPCNMIAEMDVAGSALLFREAHAVASKYCTQTDFYDARWGRVFAAAPDAWRQPKPPRPAQDDLEGWWLWDPLADRVRFAARVADVEEGDVARVVREASGAVNRYAALVGDAARRRRAMAASAAAYNLLGEGFSFDEAAQIVAKAFAA